MLSKVVLTFESVNETLACDHSYESYFKKIEKKKKNLELTPTLNSLDI